MEIKELTKLIEITDDLIGNESLEGSHRADLIAQRKQILEELFNLESKEIKADSDFKGNFKKVGKEWASLSSDEEIKDGTCLKVFKEEKDYSGWLDGEMDGYVGQFGTATGTYLEGMDPRIIFNDGMSYTFPRSCLMREVK